MGSVRSEAAAVTPLPPTKPNTAPPPAIKAVPPAIPRPPAANAPPPTAARLALVRAAPDRPATADPARTGAMTGASVNAAPPVATATAAVPAAPTIFLVRLPSNKPAFLFSALAVSCTGDLSKSPLTSLHSSSRTLESNLRCLALLSEEPDSPPEFPGFISERYEAYGTNRASSIRTSACHVVPFHATSSSILCFTCPRLRKSQPAGRFSDHLSSHSSFSPRSAALLRSMSS